MCVSHRVLLFLLPLMLRLSDQLVLNLLGDLIVLPLTEVPEGSRAHGGGEGGVWRTLRAAFTM